MGKNKFRKYGQIFEIESGKDKLIEPESPYESLPYTPPEKRPQSSVDEETAALDKLRGMISNHGDS